MVDLSGSDASSNTPFYCFFGQIRYCFDYLSLTEAATFFYIRRIFKAMPIITNCIIGTIWVTLILLFGLIDKPNHNTLFFSFNNFNFETENWIVRDNIVENKLSPIAIFINILDSTTGFRVNNFEFMKVCLLKFSNIQEFFWFANI